MAKLDRQIESEKRARGWLSSNDPCTIWRAVEEDLRRRGAGTDQQSHVGTKVHHKSDNRLGADTGQPRMEQQQPNQQQQLLQDREREMIRLWAKCRSIYNNIRTDRRAELFKEPVDTVKYNVPDYYDVIKRPMDLTKVGKKLGVLGGRRSAKREYKTPLEFKEDMELIWANCRTYNSQGHKVGIFT